MPALRDELLPGERGWRGAERRQLVRQISRRGRGGAGEGQWGERVRLRWEDFKAMYRGEGDAGCGAVEEGVREEG